MPKIKVGIIGFGLSGKLFHTAMLKAHKGFEILRVCTKRIDEVKSVLPNATVSADPYELISANNLDLIINCAPNAFHYSYTAAALESGKHVVVEKPFVNTAPEGEKLISLAKQHRKTLSVFHNRRWDADFLTIKKLIAKNTLGEIKQFESHFDRWRPTFRAERWKEQDGVGSGIFYDLGPHLIDQALALFGLPEQVLADIGSQKNDGMSDDYFHVILKYGKMRVILHASSFTNFTPRFQIWGDQAGYVKYSVDPQEDQLREGLSALDPSFGIEEEKKSGQLLFPDNRVELLKSERGQYTKFYEELHDCLAGNGEPPVLAEEALSVIKIIELAQQSSETARAINYR